MTQFEKLPLSFYNRADVVQIARELIGKIVVTSFSGLLTAGRIVETEAYAGTTDRASHAWNNRRTARTEVMFGPPGYAYVYLCYGMHHLFNVVTNREAIPHAVLIRALEPCAGIVHMMLRTRKTAEDKSLTKGPGNLSNAMGIKTPHSGYSLLADELFIARGQKRVLRSEIGVSARIGVDYAGADARLPYRFYLKNNAYVSGLKT